MSDYHQRIRQRWWRLDLMGLRNQKMVLMVFDASVGLTVGATFKGKKVGSAIVTTKHEAMEGLSGGIPEGGTRSDQVIFISPRVLEIGSCSRGGTSQ